MHRISLKRQDTQEYSMAPKMEDIEAVLAKGHFVVMPLDMCGAIAMKRHFFFLLL